MLETSGTKPSEMAYLLRPRRLGARGAVVLCALALVLAAAASWASPPPVRETLASVSYTGRLDLPGGPLPARVMLPAETIYQWPELPNGCEATTLAMLLRGYGFAADKLELAYTYIPREDFSYEEDAAFGPDPERAYAGDPAAFGFYCFSGALKEGADAYLESVGSALRAVDLTGCSVPELRAALAQGHPLAVWASIGLEALKESSFTWALDDGTLYRPYSNLHCMLLYGYDKDSYYLLDPLYGPQQVPRLLFEVRWQDMGSRALALSEGVIVAPFRIPPEPGQPEDPAARLRLPGADTPV